MPSIETKGLTRRFGSLTAVDSLSFEVEEGEVFGLTPTVALAGIGLTVIISVRVKGFKEAQQISVVLLAPILALVVGQLTGAIIFGPLVVLALTGVFAIIDLVVFKTGVKIFRREEILSKQA